MPPDVTIEPGLSEESSILLSFIRGDMAKMKLSILRGMHTGDKTFSLLGRLVNAMCGAEPIHGPFMEAMEYVRKTEGIKFGDDEVIVPISLLRTIVEEMGLPDDQATDAERDEIRRCKVAISWFSKPPDADGKPSPITLVSAQFAMPRWFAHAIAYRMLACVGVYPDQPWHPTMKEFRALLEGGA